MNTHSLQPRPLAQRIQAQPATDGAGVKLQRVLAPSGMAALDPFLLLDEINSDDEADTIAGFPPHPHRGFETLTYMREGAIRHEDHLGNQRQLTPGGVQWMTTGRGIIHSEMPQPDEGRLHGFQLWLNLPAKDKLQPPRYRDIDPEEMPLLQGAGYRLRLIAGHWQVDGDSHQGPGDSGATELHFADLQLDRDASLALPLPPAHTVLVYVYHGELILGGQRIGRRQLAMLGAGDVVSLIGGAEGGQALLLSGRPLGEPVVQYGPFVMTSVEEIEQALRDYRDGTLAG